MKKEGSMPIYESAEIYIKSQGKEAAKILTEIRTIIKAIVPDAEEIKDAKVPSYTLVPGTKPKLQLMMAAYSIFVSFYPFSGVISHFSEELKDFETGKGSIKFYFGKPIPCDLIEKMILFRKSEISRSQ
ncbi:MAG TPA: DUF1801 domain-containing protein [Saprospiraceae bacterium]|nr:DUF1801 domain-containing protein [Lewinellaceae bacterium]HPK09664.1 DUF1801 domain-containing protein [Saprospiraceae bacterium]HPQ22458.1 DUF1801 domain-containing protein [Saprospiraceae bacterium]